MCKIFKGSLKNRLIVACLKRVLWRQTPIHKETEGAFLIIGAISSPFRTEYEFLIDRLSIHNSQKDHFEFWRTKVVTVTKFVLTISCTGTSVSCIKLRSSSLSSSLSLKLFVFEGMLKSLADTDKNFKKTRKF